MSNPRLYAQINGNFNANVYINQAKGFYNKTAKMGEKVTLLEGSILEKPDIEGWIYRDLESLADQGYVERIGAQYRVVKPIVGSTSGTAAAVLGAGFKPAGFHQWRFDNDKSIHEAGER